MSGANVSTSGHITSTSRGSRVGSSASSPSRTSRSTSTWRVRPWQACTWRLRSPSSSSGRASGASPSGMPAGAVVGAQVGLQPAEQRGRAVSASGWCMSVVTALGRLRAAAASRGRRGRATTAAGGWRASAARVVPSRRGRRRLSVRGRPRSHSAAEGCGSHRWTSRCSARAASTVDLVGGEPGRPEDREPGRQVDHARVGAQRGAGGVEPLGRARGADPVAQPAPQLGLPDQVVGQRLAEPVGVAAGQPVAQHRRPVRGVGVEQPARCRDTTSRRRPGRTCRPSAVHHGSSARPVDHLEQRPQRRCPSPGVVSAVDSRRRRRPPRRPACSATGTRRWRTRPRRQRRAPPGGATAAGSASARPLAPAPRPPRRRTGRHGRLASTVANPADQCVRALGAVQVQHAYLPPVVRLPIVAVAATLAPATDVAGLTTRSAPASARTAGSSHRG